MCSLHCFLSITVTKDQFFYLFLYRKRETSEMQDLVQMMTQTLHMDARDVSLPEFKINRKYRDTLMLHGKSREGQGDFQISGFPLGNSLNLFF